MLDGIIWGWGDRLQAASSRCHPVVKGHAMSLQPLSPALADTQLLVSSGQLPGR